MQPDEALSLLKQGAAQIISEAELRAKLALGRPLRAHLRVVGDRPGDLGAAPQARRVDQHEPATVEVELGRASCRERVLVTV